MWAEPFHNEWIARRGQSLPLRLAHSIGAQWLHARPIIRPAELIVGSNASFSLGSNGSQTPAAVRSMVRWKPMVGISFDAALCEQLLAEHSADQSRIRFIEHYWEVFLSSRRPMPPPPHKFPAGLAAIGKVAGLWNRAPLAYEAALDGGIDGLRERCRRFRHAPESNSHGRRESTSEWHDALLVMLDDIEAFINNYAEAAEHDALIELDDVRRAELLNVAAVCRKISHEPPQTFREAVQLFYFLFVLAGHDSPGRIDQFLYPHLQNELDAGTITLDGAQEIVDCLWLKFEEGGTCAATLGGSNADGTDASNKLTTLCLNSLRRLKSASTSAVFRWHPETPRKLLQDTCRAISAGARIDCANDAVIVAEMERGGVPQECAVGYALADCGGAQVAGRSHGGCDDATLNVAKALELVLHEGRTAPASATDANLQLGPTTGELATFDTFELFQDAVRRQIEYAIGVLVHLQNSIWEWAQSEVPELFRSLLVHSCVEKGKDWRAGGADCKLAVLNVVGLTNLANSLLAIKRSVYDQQHATLDELAAALDSDFAGAELRRHLLDCIADDADGQAAQILAGSVEHISGCVQSRRTPHGAAWRVGFPLEAADCWGKTTAATPDGRGSGTPLASPCGLFAEGAEMEEMLRAITAGRAACLPLQHSITIRKDSITGRDGLGKLVELVAGFLGAGGRHLRLRITARKKPAGKGKHAARAGITLPVSLFDSCLVSESKTRTR